MNINFTKTTGFCAVKLEHWSQQKQFEIKIKIKQMKQTTAEITQNQYFETTDMK